MGKSLVIIEAPGKLSSFKKYLPKTFDVIASVGHVLDLPQKKFGINIKKDFEPQWEVMPGKDDILKKIVKEAKKSDVVIMMTDADREGSGIAANIHKQLPSNVKVKRAVTNSITKKEILDAINNAYDITDDKDIVDSYECRRMLDRVVGWKCSFITKQATGGQSAGRVQSSCLRILAEREKEIKAFVPQEYWPIFIELLTDKNEKILADIRKPKPLEIKTGEQAKKICDNVRGNTASVSKYDVKVVSIKSNAPFTTSTLLQASGSILGWKPDKTMKIAQQLYETSLCTYHRTDSVYVVPDFITDTRNLINTKYGSKYLPANANIFSSKKMAQGAHEACRVTDLSTTSVPDIDKNKLYDLIWRRSVSSQMSPMQQERKSAEFICYDYLFGASGNKVLFDGWRKVWHFGLSSEKTLPTLQVGDKLKIIDVKTEQKFTEPPPRFSNTSIVKQLETLGIGRPSTYASIIKTIESRNYIENIKRSISVTDLGIGVSDFLVAADFCFIDLKFTAEMEEKLDDIANKKADKVKILKEFWERLKKDIENAKDKKDELSRSTFRCPKCDAFLLKKHSKFGPFYSCGRYKDGCKYIANVGKDGEPIEKVKVETKESTHLCPNCKQPLIIRVNKKGGEYLGCRSWQQADCKGFFDTDGNKIKFKKRKRYEKTKRN